MSKRATALIDFTLLEIHQQRLVDVNQVVNVLLDVRNMIQEDGEGKDEER